MAKQTLAWTCLPNGLSEDGNGLRVSVLVSPRLEVEAEPRELSSFSDWVDWPSTVREAVFVFYAAGQQVAKTSVLEDAGSTRHDARLGAPDSAVWRALFRKDLPVLDDPRNLDLLDSEILSYSTTDVHDLVKDLYADLASRSATALPRIGKDLLADQGWSDLIEAVGEIDRWGTNPESGSNMQGAYVPIPTQTGGPTQIETRFAGLSALMHGSPAGSARRPGGNISRPRLEVIRHLARFELFQTPPLRPKPLRRAPRTDNPDISSFSQEFTRPSIPTSQDLAATMHFHRVVAAMNSYPTLLRRLGLVVDFVLDRREFPESADFTLRVEVGLPGNKPERRPNQMPITHTAHGVDGFYACSRPHPEPEDARVEKGLLDLYSQADRYAVLQADVDGAGLKLINFARTLGGYRKGLVSDPGLLNDDVTHQDKEAGAPALRTAGIMLVRKDRALALRRRFQATKQQKQELDSNGSPDLWAEDLVRGYRIDVWDDHQRCWRSLCRRTAEFRLADGQLIVVPEAGEEEATVQLAATRSPDPEYNPKVLYLHEALVSWTGWSLGAPQPGLAIGDDVGRAEGEKPEFTTQAGDLPGLDFRSIFRALPGSLPRLRYGRSYALRARVVDLAGQSLPPFEKDFGPEQPLVIQPFLRFEPVAAPVLALLRPDQGSTERPLEGESMYRLAIRSFNAVFDDPTPSSQIARRQAVPPQSTGREAELCGKLDREGIVDPATFQMLALEKDLDPRDPSSALVEETLALKGPLDRDAVDTSYAVWQDGMPLTYLPDPLAEEVVARFLGHPSIPSERSLRIPLYPADASWPDAQPFRIELYDDGANPLALPAFDDVNRVFRIPLAKGEKATLRLSMALRKQDLDEPGRIWGIWQWLDPATQVRIEAAAINGQCWLLTPWQDVELVHAVQKPLIIPEIKWMEVSRVLGETSAVPTIITTCSLKSTDRLDLLANWNEPYDEPGSPPGNRIRDDLAFHVKVTDASEYLRGTQTLPDHTLPADENLGPVDIGINSNGRLNPTAFKRNLSRSKVHEFNDTRYRRIEYRLKATSRYREFLPQGLLLEPDPALDPDGPHQQVETHLVVEGSGAVSWIPSSKPPPPPQVLYVVPTFGWVRSRDEAGTSRSWRRGGGLRVYLDRPWNLSGYGEMLAVVLPPAEFKGNPDPDTESLNSPSAGERAPYKSFITQWGNDPIWASPFVHGIAPSRDRFPLARWQADPTGDWLPSGAPRSEADQPPGSFNVGARGVAGGQYLTPPQRSTGLLPNPVEIAPHDVFFDSERQLWYCDIEIDQGTSYWPFVRLALARYQPCSTAGAHLSEVVLADFMQLTADRWLTVRSGPEGRTRFVTVYGQGYTNSSGAGLNRSEVNPLTGQVTSYSAVAKTSVINVWLERLEPALGEDFGWERIPAVDGKLLPADGAGHGLIEQVRLLERLTPEQSHRARILNQEGDFSSLLKEGLAERVFPRSPLWDGWVEIPEGLMGHLRLVVAEYEEYPIDGPPEKDGVSQVLTGRRLVFVEHVPLGE